MKKLIKILILVVFSISMTSCYYDQIEEVEIPDGTAVSFADDITPIFTDYNCTECHGPSRNPDLSPGNEYSSLVPEYVSAGNADNSELFNTLNGGHANVSSADLALIEAWINNGALNN